ncbi:DNA polymerase-3 subunit epsilon [Azospirillum lipoferum]|uniref:3'-5' exonuclease n=1 Tax=Azospirillum TaxID=191 RepID=UPI001478760A|nr:MULTISPECIES: exonuclease domain-containing protein [Azospirillum]MCP1609830.1 DNA polymerase-3 subunit epsilon [Azospirillum lipoferum]MDW5534866.1 exonuclease domain-containing protein [Azospirillum sp. NL1]
MTAPALDGLRPERKTGGAPSPASLPRPLPRRMIPLAFRAAGLGLVVLAVGLAVAVRGSDASDPLLTYAVVMTAACAAAVWGLWLAVDRYLLRAAETLSREAGLIAHGNAEGAVGGRVPLARYGDLLPIARAVNELSDKLAQVRRDIARTVAESTFKAEEQKTQLAAVLRDLHEGVLVCNTKHQILLYNQTALDILHLTGELGLGRSLLHFVVAEPVTHTLERLTLRVREGRHINHEHGTTAQFVGATTDGRILLEGRMSAILQDPAPASDEPPGITGPIITGYVLTLSDATSELAALGQRDALLREATEGFRAPIANLRAAVETLYDAPDLGPGDRAAFESAMLDSCDSLSQRLERVTTAYRNVVTGSWPMSDIHSNNLITLVAHRMGAESATTVTLTGLPQWVHGDSHSLVLLFAYLIRRVQALTGATAFDLEAAGPQDGDRWVYLDLVWQGSAVPSATLDGWLDQTLPDGLGGLSAGDVLQHHRSTAWSEPLPTDTGTGRARLRVPLPPAQSPRTAQPRPKAGARPEFFDFGLLHQPLATSELGRTPLDRLHYVVFDTETTGLSPSTGDEIIQIAAVRVVGGRILTGETFNTLVDPRRPIPPESVPFHGITDGMVAGRPTIDTVLPQFRSFVSGAVLVAHNAAFDLKFLKMKERAAGVAFDCPVLDTMLLSRMLLGNDGDHTLDGIAERLGIEVVDRHTALGDSLVTAAVFLRMIEMLRERDVRTLDDAIRGANILVELAARERAF